MGRLAAVCDELLAAVAEAFEATPRPPEIRYVADGQPALDFGSEDALIVSWDRLRPGLGLAAPVDLAPFQAAAQISAEVSVWVLRAAPVPDDSGSAPTPEELTEAAHLMLDDAELVLGTVVGGLAAGTLFGTCAVAAFIDTVAFGPQGGVEGSRLRLAIGL